MVFRRSDLQEAFFVPGTHAFRVWGYGVSVSATLNTQGNFIWGRQNSAPVAMEAAYRLVDNRALSGAEVEQNRQAFKVIVAGRGIALP